MTATSDPTVHDRYDLRTLTPEDADVIAPAHVQIWRDTYSGLLAQSVLDGLDVERSIQRWREWLGSNEPPRVLGAFDRATGEFAGWICVGAARDDDPPAPTELCVLNLVTSHHGTGLAHELVRRELPDEEPAYLWVVAGNERAIAFYRKHGFELDGATKVQDDEGNVDLRMVRHVSNFS